MNFKEGDWIVFKFVDLHRILRAVTGKIIAISPDQVWVIFRSDGGQPGYPRGKQVRVRISEIEHSTSPYAP